MFWDLAISKNRQALATLIAGLFTLAGWRRGEPQPEVLGPVTIRRLSTLLTKLEAALRRLLVLYVHVRNVKPCRMTDPQHPLPDFASFERSVCNRPPRFNLFDPRKPLYFSSAELTAPPSADAQAFQPDTAVEADMMKSQFNPASVLNRLAAIDHALRTLPRQAKRLARELEKRENAPPGPGRVGPIRPGIPPGLGARSADDADFVLRECHGLVRDLEISPP